MVNCNLQLYIYALTIESDVGAVPCVHACQGKHMPLMSWGISLRGLSKVKQLWLGSVVHLLIGGDISDISHQGRIKFTSLQEYNREEENKGQ